ncbi:MAG: leucine-rich repeat domain-containing protein, partial [Methanosarcina sp.]
MKLNPEETNDKGYFTAIESLSNGIVADEAILFNKELEKNGYQLTTYFSSDLKRVWAIYRIDDSRPRMFKNCLIRGKTDFNALSCKTKNSSAYIALVEIKKQFRRYHKKNNGTDSYFNKPVIPFANEMSELRELIIEDNSLQSLKAILKLKEINNTELENAIVQKTGYEKGDNWNYGHLYLKQDSFFLPRFNDSAETRIKLFYFVFFIIGYSTCKAAMSLKKRITSLGFFGYQEILNIPAEIRNFQNLKKLSFYGSKIKNLPEEIGELKNLEILELKSTALTTLPRTIGQLENMTELDLNSAKLTTLP